MEFRDDTPVIDKPPSRLDELVLGVMGVFDDCGVEDAVYLYELTESTLNTETLESYVERLHVKNEYDELGRT